MKREPLRYDLYKPAKGRRWQRASLMKIGLPKQLAQQVHRATLAEQPTYRLRPVRRTK